MYRGNTELPASAFSTVVVRIPCDFLRHHCGSLAEPDSHFRVRVWVRETTAGQLGFPLHSKAACSHLNVGYVPVLYACGSGEFTSARAHRAADPKAPAKAHRAADPKAPASASAPLRDVTDVMC